MLTIKAHTACFYRSEGCLYCDTSGVSGSKFQSVQISSWETGLQTKVLLRKGYLCEDRDKWQVHPLEDVIVISPGRDNLQGRDIPEFLAQIPSEVLELAAPFQYQQLAVLRLLRYEEGRDLARHSPIIFWLLAERFCGAGPTAENELAQLVQVKRRDILKHLGYIDSKAAIKLLAKVRLSSFDQRAFEAFKKILSITVILEELRHCPSITENELFAVNICPSLLARPFLKKHLANEFASRKSISSVWDMYRDTVRLARALRQRGFTGALRAFKQVQQLQRLHDRLADELNQKDFEGQVRKLEVKFGKVLPKPVFPATEKIVPIRTVRDLVMESRDMQHCVSTYVEKNIQGKCSIYRVLGHERGTVEIDTSGTSPVVAQVRLFRNGVPDGETFAMVNKWFETNQEKKA